MLKNLSTTLLLIILSTSASAATIQQYNKTNYAGNVKIFYDNIGKKTTMLFTDKKGSQVSVVSHLGKFYINDIVVSGTSFSSPWVKRMQGNKTLAQKTFTNKTSYPSGDLIGSLKSSSNPTLIAFADFLTYEQNASYTTYKSFGGFGDSCDGGSPGTGGKCEINLEELCKHCTVGRLISMYAAAIAAGYACGQSFGLMCGVSAWVVHGRIKDFQKMCPNQCL